MKKACDVYGTTKPPIKTVHVKVWADGEKREDVDEALATHYAELSERGIERLCKFIERGMAAPTQQKS